MQKENSIFSNLGVNESITTIHAIAELLTDCVNGGVITEEQRKGCDEILVKLLYKNKKIKKWQNQIQSKMS